MMPRAAWENWTGLVVKEGPRYCFGFDIGIGNCNGNGIVMVDGAKRSVGGPLRCTLDSLVVEERGPPQLGPPSVTPVWRTIFLKHF